MFQTLSAVYKIATNASAGFNLLKKSLEKFKCTMLEIDNRAWDEIVADIPPSDNYDQQVMYAFANMIELFPSGISGLFSIDTKQVRRFLGKIDPDLVPKINSPITFQLGSALVEHETILEVGAVKEIINGLVEAKIMDPNNLLRRQQLLKTRVFEYNRFQKTCHALDNFKDSDLIKRINSSTTLEAVNQLEQEFLTLRNVYQSSKDAYKDLENFIKENNTSFVLELSQHYTECEQIISDFILNCEETINQKKRPLLAEKQSGEENYRIILAKFQTCNQKLKKLDKQAQQANSDYQQTVISFNEKHDQYQSSFHNQPDFPNLLTKNETELSSFLYNYKHDMKLACTFFEKLIPRLRQFGARPVKLDKYTRDMLDTYLKLGLCPDIPSPNWQELMGLVNITLDDGEYNGSNWFSQLSYQIIQYLTGVDETDAEYLIDIIQDKLTFFRHQLSNSQPIEETVYLQEEEFLKLEQLQDIIKYQRQHPQRLVILEAKMGKQASLLESLIPLCLQTIIKIEYQLAYTQYLEIRGKSLISRIASSLPIRQQIALLTESIESYGLYHQPFSTENPGIQELKNKLENQAHAISEAFQQMEMIMSSDPVGDMRRKFKELHKTYQQRVDNIKLASNNFSEQAIQKAELERHNDSIELLLLFKLKVCVNCLEKGNVNDGLIADYKDKLQQLLSRYKNKLKLVHSDDISAHENKIKSIEDIQNRLKTIKIPEINSDKINSQNLYLHHCVVDINLHHKFFGNPAKLQKGLFNEYLDKRAEKYAFKDFIRKLIAVFLGCFGYQTDQHQRQHFVTELEQASNQFFLSPQDIEKQQVLQSKIDFGLKNFPPRAQTNQLGYEESLHAILTQYEAELASVMPETPATISSKIPVFSRERIWT